MQHQNLDLEETDWPTIVFESGLSEPLRLRNDAAWWLVDSGEVKIVIIISITPAQKRLRVGKWCLAPPSGNRPATRASNANSPIPTRMQQISITQNPATPQTGTTVRPAVTVQPGTAVPYAVAGAPLILDFQSVLLRPPVPPEGDVVLGAVDLSLWADGFWECVSSVGDQNSSSFLAAVDSARQGPRPSAKAVVLPVCNSVASFHNFRASRLLWFDLCTSYYHTSHAAEMAAFVGQVRLGDLMVRSCGFTRVKATRLGIGLSIHSVLAFWPC